MARDFGPDIRVKYPGIQPTQAMPWYKANCLESAYIYTCYIGCSYVPGEEPSLVGYGFLLRLRRLAFGTIHLQKYLR